MIYAIPAGDLTPKVGEYVCSKVHGLRLDIGMYQAFAFVDQVTGDFVGGCVISNYRRTDCEISCAAENSMAFRRHVMQAVFQYIFHTLGCVRCTSITTKGNKRARAFLEALGFELEGNLRRGYDGERDALLYGLLREDCRYLGAEGHGEEIRTSSANAA